MRDKFLTEAIGECWHSDDPDMHTFTTRCRICGEAGETTNFSTWQGFGKLWEWAQNQGWWEDFWIYSNDDNGIIDFIHPDRFADALYEFLKDK